MGKKVGTVIALIVILAGAAALAVWRLGPSSKMTDTARKAREMPVTVMDVATLEKVTTVTVIEWASMKREPTTGHGIDAKHGGRRLANIIKCVSCKAEIPDPGSWQPPAEKGYIGYFRQEYKCPICKKPACEEGLVPPDQREPGPGDLKWPGTP